MRVQNTSKRMYQHSTIDKDNKLVTLNLYPGADLDVPENVAKMWLETGDIIEYIDPSEAKAKEAKAVEVIAKLEKENETLRAELEKLKAEAKAKDGTKTLEELKKEADDLGIEYAKNISAKTLQEKIDTKKAEQK